MGAAHALEDVDKRQEQAGREDTCYERKGSLCRDKRNCTKTRCLGCGSVCEAVSYTHLAVRCSR